MRVTIDEPFDEAAIKALEITGKVAPYFHGHEPEVQSAALADLLATWLAGHFIFDDKDKVARQQTDELRRELFANFTKTTWSLVEVNESMLLEARNADDNSKT